MLPRWRSKHRMTAYHKSRKFWRKIAAYFLHRCKSGSHVMALHLGFSQQILCVSQDLLQRIFFFRFLAALRHSNRLWFHQSDRGMKEFFHGSLFFTLKHAQTREGPEYKKTFHIFISKVVEPIGKSPNYSSSLRFCRIGSSINLIYRPTID